MKYNFYYDESEHSRKITYSTINGETYYDNFLTVIVGWSIEKEFNIQSKYNAFEEKYAERKKKNELKSDTFKNNQFHYGFASFNKPNIEMMDDLLSIIDDDFYIYICVESKIEFIILQLFRDYQNSFIVNMDAIRYSIVKAILAYHPQEVIENIYSTPEKFINSLIGFFTERIEYNKKNIELKASENEAFENILLVLGDVEPPITFDWDYHIPFIGFDKFLKNKGICNYSLVIDKEGEANERSKTLSAATGVGLNNCTELNSKSHFGLRIADMLAGIVGKIMKSLYCSLHNKENNGNVTKNLLDKRWFQLNEKQLQLYKKLHHIILEINSDWYKVYAGNYSDDLISFLALLDFMNQFENVEQIKKDLDMQPEYCNGCMCHRLEEYFQRMRNKLPIEYVIPEKKNYYRNKRGAKIYFDINKQPVLKLKEGQNSFYILSVGNSEGCPLVTIRGKSENICYRIPDQLNEWAMTVTGIAMMGVKLFPSEVIITKIKDHYYADIL
ncbi:MAG: hypothetical protein K2O42_10790 [Oscillospiraceae bacterium]|nr:hypothetical protein [Oscillospiraceae bacterium]